MATVSFDQATRIYPGTSRPAVDQLTLEVAAGEFLVMVGPSGCGKSTTLRMLAGLEPVDRGGILIDGADVTTKPPKDRDIAMVFQNYALYPHMTVRDNMGFALKCAGVPKSEIAARVQATAKMLGLESLLDRRPKALSGGQRQRVAMGRAIARNPQVFLMDEPLSNLDAKLRVQMRSQIASLQRKLGITTLYVTHDQTEAMTMGNRIAVLKDGLLQQVASPREMYDHPANQFVASFIGSPAMNLLAFQMRGDRAWCASAWVRLPRTTVQAIPADDDGKIVLGFRPENLVLLEADEGSGVGNLSTDSESLAAWLPIVVDAVEELGADTYVYCHLAAGASKLTDRTLASPSESEVDPGVHQVANQVVIRVEPHTAPQPGTMVVATTRPEQIHAFEYGNQQRRLPDQ